MKSLLLTAAVIMGFTSASLAQNLPGYVPTNGLVGWWPFNGNANDESGNGNNGTVNGATLTTDRFGSDNKAYSFDGVGNYINIPNSSIAAFGLQSFTCLAWFKLIQNSQGGTFVRYDNCVSNSGWGIQAGGEGKIDVLEFSSTRVPNIVITQSSYNDNLWHMAVFIRNTELMKNQIFIDGQLVSESPFTEINLLNNTGSVLRFGSCAGFYFYQGIIDDIGIWNRALNQEEISNLYNTTITGFSSPFEANTIKVFPNPASDHITIDYGNFAFTNGYNLKIENFLGQPVFQTRISQQSDKISLSNWGGNGLYFVKISDSQGNTIATRKIVLAP